MSDMDKKHSILEASTGFQEKWHENIITAGEMRVFLYINLNGKTMDMLESKDISHLKHRITKYSSDF